MASLIGRIYRGEVLGRGGGGGDGAIVLPRNALQSRPSETYVAGGGGRWRCTRTYTYRLVSTAGSRLWVPPFRGFHVLSKIPLYNLYISPTRALLSSSKRVVARDEFVMSQMPGIAQAFAFSPIDVMGPSSQLYSFSHFHLCFDAYDMSANFLF